MMSSPLAIAGVAGIYTSCCEIFKQIQSVRRFHKDSANQVKLLELQAYRVVKWVESRRICERASSASTSTSLQKDEQHLDKVLTLFQEVRDLFDKYGIQYDTSLSTLHATSHSAQSASDSQQSRKKNFVRKVAVSIRRADWPIIGRVNLIEHCSIIRNYVDSIYSVWPVLDQPKEGSSITAELAAFLDDILGSRKLQELALLEYWLDLETTKYNPHQDLEDLLEKLEPDSCKWIFNVAEYKSWINVNAPSDTSSILWVNGLPGYGKSLLCANIVDDISKTKNHVAFFFSSAHAQAGGRIDYILRFWILQLAEKELTIRKLSLSETSRTKATKGDIWSLFRKILSLQDSIIFIVDGLDEYHRHRQTELNHESYFLSNTFLQELKQAFSNGGHLSRLLVVSRLSTDIKTAFRQSEPARQSDLLSYSIIQEDVLPDIQMLSRRFITSSFQRFSAGDQEELISCMVRMSEGSFLWIDSVKRRMKPYHSKGLLERTITQLPVYMSKRYEQQLSRLSRNDPAKALCLIQWALLAKQPLSVWEICQVLAVKSLNDGLLVDQIEFPEMLDDAFIDENILNHCEELIVMQPRLEPAETSWPGHAVLKPTHPSVADYILPLLAPSCQSNWNQQLFPTFKTTHSAQFNVAMTCLAYLMDDDVELDLIVERPSENAARLKDYALKFWHVHLMEAPDAEHFPLEMLSKFFQADSDSFFEWAMKIERSRLAEEDRGFEIGTPLYYAVILGHIPLVTKMLLDDPIQLNVQSGTYQTPAMVALVYQRHSLFKKLIDAGAESETSVDELFLKAAELGYLESVQILTEHAANVDLVLDINMRSPGGFTPLILAATYGHVDVVEFLLSRPEIQINLKTKENRSALYVSIMNHHITTVESLIKNGADATSSQAYGNTPLYLACLEGDRKIFDAILRQSLCTDSLNHRNDSGATPLWIAAEQGHYQLVDILLKHGADPQIVASNGLTPLSAACVCNQLDAVRLLLEQNIFDVNHTVHVTGSETKADALYSTSHPGSTPLILAAIHGHVKIMLALLEIKGIDIDAENNAEKTALVYSASNGLQDMVVKLIGMGANLSQARSLRTSPLYAGIKKGHYEVVKILLSQNVDVELDNAEKCEMLKMSGLQGWTPVLELLAARWPQSLANTLENSFRSVSALNRESQGTNARRDAKAMLTSCLGHFLEITEMQKIANNAAGKYSIFLALAAAVGNEFQVSEILNRMKHMGILKANIDGVGSSGATALWHATINSHTKVVEILLSSGADATKCPEKGTTPLHAAVMAGQTEIMKLLIVRLKETEQFAFINQLYGTGDTLLNSAASQGNVELVELLLDNGADATLSNGDGWTPLLYATGGRHVSVISILLSHLKRTNRLENINDMNNERITCLWIACYHGYIDIVRILLEHDAEVCQPRYKGLTPINAAVVAGHIQIVRMLLEHPEVDVSTACHSSRTPLANAAFQGNWHILQLLIEKDPMQINSVDHNGRTPLMVAVAAKHTRNVHILLKEPTIETDTCDHGGSTALDHAAWSGSVTITRSLLHHGKHIGRRDARDLPSLNQVDSAHGRALRIASREKHPHLVRALLRQTDINTGMPGKYGRSALHYAAISGSTLSVWSLLQSDRSLVNRVDLHGITPLSLAARHHRKGVVNLLMSIPGINYEQKDHFGFSAIDWLRLTGLKIDSDLLLDDTSMLVTRLTSQISDIPRRSMDRFWCDVCTLSASDKTRYHCNVCCNANFDICMSCSDRGAYCIDKLHVLEIHGPQGTEEDSIVTVADNSSQEGQASE